MPIKLSTSNTLFLEEFAKDLEKIPLLEKENLKKILRQILEEKREVNIKKLRNFPLARYRLRISNYRLLFNFEDGKAIFIYCKHRKSLY